MRATLLCALPVFWSCSGAEGTFDGGDRQAKRAGRPGARSSASSEAPGAPIAAEASRSGPGSPPEYVAFLMPEGDGFVDEFGAPLAFDGDTLVGGAPGTDVAYDDDGAAFVFVRQGGAWSQETRLGLPSAELADGQHLGWSLAVQGDVVAAGAPLQGNGAVHLFERTGGVWTRTATLWPLFQQPDSTGYFGDAVALDGDRLVIGAPGDNSASTGVGGDPTDQGAPFSGAVHLYVRDGAGWALEAYIKPSNTTAEHGFGTSLALSGDTLVVGSGDDSGATGVGGDPTRTDGPGSGAVFVFERGPAGWSERAYVKASNTGAHDAFGREIELEGDTLVVGAPGEDSAATGVDGDQASDAAPDSGAAYVFGREGTTWSQRAYLKASNAGAGDRFGTDIALQGRTIAVAAPDEDSAAVGVDGDQASDAAPGSGAVYVFERCGAWAQSRYVKAPDTEAGDLFGYGLALSGPHLAAGAIRKLICPDPDPDDICGRGVAHVLRLDGSQPRWIGARATTL